MGRNGGGSRVPLGEISFLGHRERRNLLPRDEGMGGTQYKREEESRVRKSQKCTQTRDLQVGLEKNKTSGCGKKGVQHDR